MGVRFAVSLLSALVASGLILELAIEDAQAGAKSELRELYRGARPQAMGNAFVAVADDENAIYYNPAGLAGVQENWFQYFNLDLEVSTDTITSAQTSYSAFSNLSGDSLNMIMGKNVYGRAAITPTYVAPNFGVGLIFDSQVALRAKNKALPNITFGFQSTNGVQLGYGFSVNGGRNPKRLRGELRLGIGVKLLFRRGGYYDLTQEQLINASQDSMKAIVGGYGMGVGWDLGTQYVYRVNNRLSLTVGSAFTEIGGVKFNNDTASELPGNLSFGLAARYQFSKILTTLSYDLRHLNESSDLRMKNHLGFELGVPVLKLALGVNQTFFTYGATVDLGFIILRGVSYSEEISSVAGVDPERRYMVSVAMGM